MEKSILFEVSCSDVVTTNTVKVTNMLTGKEYYAPATKLTWENEFYASVSFLFRGQEFTVLAEVNPIINY